MDNQKAVSIIYAYLSYFEKWISERESLDTSWLDDYFTKNYTLISNGQTLVQSAEEYKERLLLFKEKYGGATFSEPLVEPLVSGSQLALHYSSEFVSHSGEKTRVYHMGIATIEDNKLASWVQVAAEAPKETWDKK